jgi:hypothetical protein
VEAAVVPHIDHSDAPWPVPVDCAVSPAVFQRNDRVFGFFVEGDVLSVGTPQPGIYYQGDNFIQLVGGQGSARLVGATSTQDTSARADILNVQPTSTTDPMALSFATLRLPVPGCWTVRVSVGGAALEYTLYAYPWQCRRQHEQYPALPGIERLPCVRR